MSQYIGESFEGHVSSITAFGIFVELDNGVDGLVPFNLMDDDHYVFDEQHYMAYGRRTGIEYHLGTPVTVTVVKADPDTRQIDFVMGEVAYIDGYLRRIQRRETTNTSKHRGSSKMPTIHGRTKKYRQEDSRQGKRDSTKIRFTPNTNATEAVETMLRKLDTTSKKGKKPFYETIKKRKSQERRKKKRKR